MTDPADYGLPPPASGPPAPDLGHPDIPRPGPHPAPGRRTGLRWRYAALAAGVAVLLVGVAGLRARSVGDGPTPQPSSAGSANPAPSFPPADKPADKPADAGPPAAATATAVVPLPSAATVRFEVFSGGTAPVLVRYGSDNLSPVRLDGQRAPFAVQAALTPENDYLSLSGSDVDTQELLMCRLLIDGVLVSLDVGRGYATCSTSRSTATPTPATGSGARLAVATPVAPGGATVPQVSADPTTVSYQVASSQPGGRVDVGYLTGAGVSVEQDAQPTPFAVQVSITTASTFLGITGSDAGGDNAGGDAGPFLVCQVHVDGALVEQSQGFRFASCGISRNQFSG